MQSSFSTDEDLTSAIHDRIVRASVASYLHSGDKAIPVWALNGERTGADPDILLPELRRIEEVATLLEKVDETRLRKFTAQGFEVWVLVPLKEIGNAHARLRGIADRIQAWWIEENNVRFGEPRLP